MTYLNFTPHEITFNNGVTFPSRGVARVSESWGEIVDFETVSTPSAIEGLPDPQDGVKYIVSAMILSASPRTDLVAPATGHPETKRNDKGHIISVPCFRRAK